MKPDKEPYLYGGILANLYLHICKRAWEDVQLVALALKLQEPNAVAGAHQKYTNSLTAKFAPDRERARLLDWLEGYQFWDIMDYLEEDGEAFAARIRKMLNA